MSFLDKMEKKLGRFAVKNLMIYLLVFYAGGFILSYVNPTFYIEHLCLNMERIFAGEIWRLVTFIIYPPSTSILWFLLEMYILFSLGRALERLWGSFYFDLYILIGILSLIVAALLVYLITGKVLLLYPDNIYLSLILAFGMTVPDMQFLLYFIIPIKAKYIMFFYGAVLAYQFVTGGWPARVQIIASLFNFFLFFLFIRRPFLRVRQGIRRAEFQRKMRETAREAQNLRPMGARHVCSVCGRTNISDPELEFRFCSRCAGNREYCLEHLYTHIHVTEDRPEQEG
ncbi:MAG: hypothetical protein J5496_02500 [Lachnospiraceae bacterium]|nr:hypothetical protein [Lachnospiraceae bacterium]